MRLKMLAVILLLLVAHRISLGAHIKGDMDDDGSVTISDALKVLQTAVGLIPIEAVDPQQTTDTPTTPVITDATGEVQLLSLVPVENFRNATNVNFSIKLKVQNLGLNRANFGITIVGTDAFSTIVFSREITMAVDAGQILQASISYGEPLTIAQYESIIQWAATDFKTY